MVRVRVRASAWVDFGFGARAVRRSGADVAGRTVASRVKLLPVAVVVSE